MKVYRIIIFLSILSMSCFGQLVENQRTYKLNDDFIYAEDLSLKQTSCKDCDNENRIFQIYKKFIYSYKYTDIKGNEFRFKILNLGKWDFTSISSKDSNVVCNIELLILPDGEHFKKSSFCQTRIGYKLHKNFLNYPTTGLIENQKNIWMHPPREYMFRILELNPFPYIKAPFQIGTEWKWELNIGPQWADKRWRIWTNEIRNVYHYKITGISTLKTELGDLQCLVIESTAKSELGETSLRSFFNEKYGFIRMEYKNIDHSTIEMNLIGLLPPTLNKMTLNKILNPTLVH